MVSAGGSATFEVSGIDLTSLGAPDNKTFVVYLGETRVGTAAIETVHIDGVPTRDGRAVVTLAVPADFPVGDTVITLGAEESGTTVKLLAEIKAAVTGPVVETDLPADGDSGAGLFAGLLLAAAGGALVLTRRRALQH
jgi:5'-nucleotidase